MSAPLQFPGFSPIIFSIGPFALRWYAIAYILGLLIGWRMLRRLVVRTPIVATALQVDDFLTWATLGVVLGGRLGYVLLYQPGAYLAAPLTIFQVWKGGMSFHGGTLGVTVALVIFCLRNRINVLGFADRLAMVCPVGLGLGRLANFVNGELYGRITGSPLGMIFPNGGPLPRYPSQLFEAGLEGVLLFFIMLVLAFGTSAQSRRGLLSGLFLIFYSLARITAEFFREPDAFMGYFAGGVTMGQLLCLPMLLLGLFLALRRDPQNSTR